MRSKGERALARCSPRGHLPLQRPTRWLKAAPLGPRGAPSPRGCRSEAAAALWCLPKYLESPILLPFTTQAAGSLYSTAGACCTR